MRARMSDLFRLPIYMQYSHVMPEYIIPVKECILFFAPCSSKALTHMHGIVTTAIGLNIPESINDRVN